jgi:hypothetical protein
VELSFELEESNSVKPEADPRVEPEGEVSVKPEREPSVEPKVEPSVRSQSAKTKSSDHLLDDSIMKRSQSAKSYAKKSSGVTFSKTSQKFEYDQTAGVESSIQAAILFAQRSTQNCVAGNSTDASKQEKGENGYDKFDDSNKDDEDRVLLPESGDTCGKEIKGEKEGKDKSPTLSPVMKHIHRWKVLAKKGIIIDLKEEESKDNSSDMVTHVHCSPFLFQNLFLKFDLMSFLTHVYFRFFIVNVHVIIV